MQAALCSRAYRIGLMATSSTLSNSTRSVLPLPSWMETLAGESSSGCCIFMVQWPEGLVQIRHDRECYMRILPK